MAAASTITAAAVGLTVGVNAWAAEPTASAPAVTRIGDMPEGAEVRRSAAKTYGERLAEIKAEQKRKAAAARRAAAKRKAAAAAAARAAREAREERQERASRSAQRSSGDPRDIAADMAATRYGWGSGEFECLDSLWEKESGWDPHASNPSSGAYGIPQALPGSKMSEYGSDWESNPATQIEWGLSYINDRYGSPCSAWETSESQGWY